MARVGDVARAGQDGCPRLPVDHARRGGTIATSLPRRAAGARPGWTKRSSPPAPASPPLASHLRGAVVVARARRNTGSQTHLHRPLHGRAPGPTPARVRARFMRTVGLGVATGTWSPICSLMFVHPTRCSLGEQDGSARLQAARSVLLAQCPSPPSPGPLAVRSVALLRGGGARELPSVGDESAAEDGSGLTGLEGHVVLREAP